MHNTLGRVQKVRFVGGPCDGEFRSFPEDSLERSYLVPVFPSGAHDFIPNQAPPLGVTYFSARYELCKIWSDGSYRYVMINQDQYEDWIKVYGPPRRPDHLRNGYRGAIRLTEALARVFEFANDWNEYKDHGLMSLRISSGFIHICDDYTWLVATLRQMLPLDAKIICPDATPVRMEASFNGCGADTWVMVFASKEWPIVPEGGLIPKMHPLFLNLKKFDTDIEEIDLVAPPAEKVGMDVRINKSTHSINIPKSRENDHQVVIEVRPK